jgi:hypothetical protein
MIEPHFLWKQAFQASLPPGMYAITLRKDVRQRSETAPSQSLWLINFCLP